MIKIKNGISIFTAALLTVASTPLSSIAMAETINKTIQSEEQVAFEREGVIPEQGSFYDFDFYSGEIDNTATSKKDDRDNLPSYVNLSNDPCFPALGNQGALGSCTAFATTYYQFSYEVNKLNGVTNSSDMVVYSPKWTYNFINGGADSGAYISDAYTVLNKYGALLLSDLQYDSNYTWLPGNTNLNSNEMITERIEALKTRLSSFSTVSLSNSGTIIDNPDDADLYIIKSLLSSGKVLTITTATSFNWKYGTDHNNATIKMNYRCSSGGGHAMAVVGYDDNAWCDVNNNGVREDCECGAFICANSYGSSGVSNDTNGFKWVLYDALNSVSSNTVNNWESSLTGTRTQAFSFSTGQPTFWSINVAHKTVNYIGEIDIDTGNGTLSDCQYKVGRAAVNSNSITYISNMLPSKSTGSYNGKIIFDYDYLCNPIQSHLSGYKWYVNFTELQGAYSFKVVDDLNNAIVNNTINSSANQKNITISTAIGDIDYSGEMTHSDSYMILLYDSGLLQLSTLQMLLADYTQDGRVNLNDYVAIEQALSNGEGLS